MDARNTTSEAVRDIEKGGIRVRELNCPGQQLHRNWRFTARNSTAMGMKFDRVFGPHRPMAEQTTNDAARVPLSPSLEPEWREQVQDDVVIVAGIEGDIFSTCLDQCPDDIQRLIAVERRDLNRNDILDFSEASPKSIGQQSSAGGGLKIKPAERED